jgi:ClpP class serine protease
MVGLEFRHEEMEKIAEEADKHGPGQIIVLLIESGGGAVTEMEQIHETLLEIKKRHRLVAWIQEAISAACATAIHCDEIYFMTEGTAGSMTAFAGGQSWQGAQLQKWLNTAGEWMELGGRSPYIGEAMIDDDKLLSYDKDGKTGKVTWYNDLSGEFILSRMDENLTFNSSNALHCGFADGIADTEPQLAKLLDLPKWYEVSDYGREIHEDWMSTVKRAQEDLPRLADELQYKNQSSGDPVKILGTQINIMKQIVQWWDRAPNVCEMSGIPPKEFLERQIAEMRRELARMKKNR